MHRMGGFLEFWSRDGAPISPSAASLREQPSPGIRIVRTAACIARPQAATHQSRTDLPATNTARENARSSAGVRPFNRSFAPLESPSQRHAFHGFCCLKPHHPSRAPTGLIRTRKRGPSDTCSPWASKSTAPCRCRRACHGTSRCSSTCPCRSARRPCASVPASRPIRVILRRVGTRRTHIGR